MIVLELPFFIVSGKLYDIVPIRTVTIQKWQSHLNPLNQNISFPNSKSI